MKIAVITDSNSGITQAEAKKIGIKIVPMPFLINGEEYFEEINLSQQEFYDKLLRGADVSTSQPSIYDVTNMWEEALKNNDEIIYIPMSSGLSASCESAISASKEYKGKVHVIDNKRISITQKQAVYDALKLIKEGKTATEIANFLMETSMQASIYIMVTTLKYLKKGGRVTPAAAALGSLLGIKPVLQIQGAKLDKLCKVMSFSVGKKKMIEQIVSDIETRFAEQLSSSHLKVCMAYTYDKDKCLEFKEEADKYLQKYNLQVEFIDPLSLSVSCHIGEGALAIAVMYKY